MVKLATKIWYKHHGLDMAVVKSDKGKHREHCLCYSCGEHAACKKAKALLKFCQDNNMVTPVWECADFMEGQLDG